MALFKADSCPGIEQWSGEEEVKVGETACGTGFCKDLAQPSSV